jgi:hypothetical protein
MAFDAEEFARQTVDAVEFGDRYAEDLEERVIRLEEIVAARWPRSWLLRRRLARELRASVSGYDDMPPGFRARRLEAVGDQVLFDARERRQVT